MIKKFWVAALAALAIGLSGYADFADAKRAGGGRSLGQQNSVINRAPPSGAQPGNAQSAQSAAAARQPGAAAQAQPRSRWMGPLAGLAAGLGLAALASALGLSEEFATIMLVLLLAMVALVAVRWFMARRAAASGRGGLAYQGSGPGGRDLTMRSGAPAGAAGTGATAAGASAVGGASAAAASRAATAAGGPTVELDQEQFVRAARSQFIRLQGAFDRGNAEELREFTTPEMFGELRTEIAQRGGAAQTTEVVALEAQFVGTERVGQSASVELAAVRFSGLLREQQDQPAVQIDEVWNFTRPANRSSGWVLAGIQQQR